jgi:hypothetical protein
MTCARARSCLFALLLISWAAGSAAAQDAASDWVTREQDALWAGVVAEQQVTDRVALWFDGSWRRMGLGARPQQLLLRPGVLVTVAPGVKVGAGYTYVATAPYGRLPIAHPTREHRSWMDLQLAHAAGPAAVTHRFRLEQRWVHPMVADTAGPTSYANRVRYRARGSFKLGGMAVSGLPVQAFAWDELLMPLGGRGQQFTLGQNRATVGVALPLSHATKVELAYMNLYNAFPSRRANEVNHTLWLSWHYTGERHRR